MDNQPLRPLMRQELLPVVKKQSLTTTSKAKKQSALAIARVCEYILQQERIGGSRNVAVRLMLAQAELGELPLSIANALGNAAVGKNQWPSRSTVMGWCAKFDKAGGVDAVIKKHKGRVRKDQGWEALAVDLFNQPSRVSMASVAHDLRRIYAFDCTDEQVRSYLTALPASLGKNSPARIGPKLHKLTQKAFVTRHTRNLKVGSIYQADGYRADVYLAHPVSGKIWRPEIMHVIDLKSRVLVGYRIMANERGYDIMVGWAEIFAQHNHVPPLLYVDNGSGYKNHLADDELSGYYARAGVQFVIHSLPQNPHGKGHIEQYHRLMRDNFLKSWKPQFYCGDDMADEVRSKTALDCNAGKLTPPSLAEFIEAYNDWLRDDYHQRPHPENKYVTRAQEWAELVPILPHATAEDIAKPQVTKKVARASVRLNNRRYQHPDLYEWNGQKVLVEYDVLNHATVTVRDAAGRLICEAPMVESIGVVGDSFLADMEAKAHEAAAKRLQKKVDELNARAGLVIDADAVASDAQNLLNSTPALPEPEIEIDIYNFE